MITETHKLIKRCLDNDPKAQQQLYEEYASKMYGVCVRYFFNDDDAKEAFQEGWIKVFQNLAQYRNASLLSTWMHRIFISTSVDLIRKSNKEKFHYSINEEILALADDDVEEDLTISLEDGLGLLKGLPEKYRVVLNLYAIDGLSHTEIAGILGISEAASRTQLSRARVLIKESLKKSNLNHETIKPSYR